MASRKKKNANNLEIVSLNEHKNRRMNVTSLDEHKRRMNEAAELLEQKREQRRRQDEIKRQREEAQRKNRITVQSVYGTPTRGGTLKNELTEKAGPYRSAAGSLSGYMKDLKDRSSTLSGTKLQGPVVSEDKALENYRKQEQKKQEEAQRKNKILLQSAYGTPTRGGTLKNELTEKTGTYKTSQNALNNYFKDLKKRSSTLSGTTLDGPVVKPEQALENYKKIIQKKQKEAQRKNRIMVQSNYGTPTRGGMLKNELTEKAGQYRNMSGALSGYTEELRKQSSMKNSPIVDYRTAEGRLQERNLQKALEELYRKQQEVSGTGNDTWETNKDKIGNLNIENYNQLNANRMNGKQQGIYDIGTNPMYMSNAGLDNFYSKWNQQAADTRKKAEEYRNAGYADLFDYIEGLDRQNEEAILRGNYTHEQQATADRTLKELNDTHDQRRQAAMDNGRRTIEGYKNYGYQYGGSDTDKTIIRNQDKKVLYHTLTGENYDERTANMTEEQINELDSKIEEARENILNYSQDEYDSMLREADADEHIARKVLEEKATRGKIDEFTNWSRHYDSAEYDPSLVETGDILLNGTTEVLTVKGPKGSREDKAYYYMNNIPESDQYGNTFGMTQKEYFATPEMVDTYNRLYKADKENGTNMAGAFLDAIDPYLSSWKNEYDDYYVRNMSENPLTGIPMRLLSYPMNAINAIPSMINTGLALLGNKYAADPNNPVNQINKLNTTTREEQNKDIDRALGGNGAVEFVLGIADSIGDNVMAMGTGGLVTGGNVSSKAGMAVVQLIMSGEATGHTFLEKLEENTDPTEAALYAIGDGVIEWFTEKVSLEALLKPDVKSMLGNTKKLLKYFGLTSLAEGSEEIASDLLNWGLDYILSMAFDHETELKERYYDLIESGMEETKAWDKALREKFEEIGMSGLAGAISGGLMGMGRAGINALQSTWSGNKLQTAGKTNKLIYVGMQSREGSLSRENAEALQRRIETGKKVSSAEVGKLAQSIMLESREKIDNTIEEVRTESIIRDLQEQNVPAEEAKGLEKLISKALDKGGIENLSRKERAAIHESQAAIKTLYKYSTDTKIEQKLLDEIGERTKAERGTMVSVSSMFRNPAAENMNRKPGRNYESADSDGYRNATGTEVQGRMGVIVYGKDSVQHAKLLSISSTKNRKGQLMYNVEIDGKQQLVDASKIRTKNAGTAAIIESASDNPGFYNQGYVNAMLLEMNNAKEDVNPGTFMMDAMRIRYAALEWQAMPETQIPADMAQRLYDTAGKAYEKYRNNEQEKTKVNKPGQGVVRFKGADAGTAEFDAALDKSGLSEREKENVRALAGLMKAAGGQDVTFVDNDDIREMEKTRKGLSIFKGAESELYGEQSISGILVNIEGQNYTRDLKTGEKKATGRHHFGIALGHEFTHFLQTHSVNGWNEVAKYVMDEQRKALGEKGLNEAISNYMNNQGISLEKAIAEFVADSCESIFNNKDVLDHIQQTNKTLYGKIRDFVKDLINRVQKAMKGSNTSMTAAGARMVNANLRELAKRFNLAYDEAISGITGNETATAEDISRLSRAQLDDAYMDAVESGDKNRIQLYVDEAAKRARYTEKAYHGTDAFGYTKIDMAKNNGHIFVAYNSDLAASYTFGDIREIGKSFMENADESAKRQAERIMGMKDSELMDYIRNSLSKTMQKYNFNIMDPSITKDGKIRLTQQDTNTGASEQFELSREELAMIAGTYQKSNAGVYQLYTRPGKQLVIDAKGAKWNQIAVPWTDKLIKTDDIADYAMQNGYDSLRINNVKDKGFIGTIYGKGEATGDIGVFFNQQDVKSADPVTYDDNGDVIPLSERFSDKESDIRYSRAITEEQQAEVDAAEEQGVDLDPVNQTASMFFSRASFERSEYYKNPKEMAKMLARNVLGSESVENIQKATKWIKDVTSISAMIARNPKILDYVASPGRSSFKSNPEYGGSIDSSTICAKRRLQTGTLDAIQRALPDYAMTAEDFLRVRRMMKERGYEVSCGLCFVESSRKNIAKYAKQFMNEWNSQHPENQVNMTQINTVLGLEETRTKRKEVYDAYEKFMNKLAQRKPKLFEMRSEYDNDIIKHFRNDDSVEAKNKNGGMRINSFSDFEIVHLIDMMQVIMDMSNVGLAGQAYTKVREFAEALGPTGLKINMSMIAAGVDENGRIIFDEIEGMKWSDVEDLRNKYADNVGTVCVVFTEDQLMAAMADDRIDFIIPFHRSQWSKSNYADIGLPENVKDFTYWQNERYAKPVYGTKKDGTPKKLRATNYMPNQYWNPNLSGKENAEAYLKMCAENNKIPKFWKWLQPNGDGSFRLKDDGSTDGYWKLLGDFKMYNHLTGDYAAQMPVRPDFDMKASKRMLREYKGGHESFPEATDVVQDFVKEKKEGRKGLSTGKNGRIQLAGNEIENSRLSRWTESGMDVNYWMEHVTPSALQTEDEWKMVQAYRGKRTSMALSLKKQLDMKAQIRQLEGKADLTTEDRDALIKLRNNLKTEQDKYARLEDEIADITSDSGWAGIMRQHNVVFRDYMEGKTQEQVQAAIDSLTEEVKRSDKRITDLEKDLAKLEEQNPVKTVKKLLARKGLSRTVNALRSEYSTAMSEEELKNRMAEIVIKNASGEDITTDVEALARDMLERIRGEQNENLAYLRGTTLNIGESVLDEYIAERGLLNEVRKNDRESDETVLKRARKAALQEIRGKIKGSGVKIIAEGKTRFREQWNDLRERNGGLKDISEYRNENNALNVILDDISGYMETSAGNQQYNVGPELEAELEAFITASANIMLNEETGGMNKTQLIEAIRKGAGPINQALAAVREVKGSMEGLKAAGQKAQTWAGVLNEDTQEALKYYNKMARLAAETERRRVKESVIETLKSDHAKAMLQQAEKFREQIANDKKARELAEDNAALRSKISTVATRMANRIFAETDQKNVPEETKGLVRQVLNMISQHDGYFRKVTHWNKNQLDDVRLRLTKMMASYGQFDPDTDLDWLVVKAANPEDNDTTARDKVQQDLIDIETGLVEYRNAEGQGRISLADRKAALTKVQKALSEIWDVVKARSELEIEGRKMQVIELAELMRDDMAKTRRKGNRIGFGSKARDTISGGITWGNLTPEYFFKNLKNKAMDLLHRGLKIAENDSGLEAAQAKERLAEIAQATGFATWDGKEEHKVKTRSGEITMTTEQIMALYATWLRESSNMRPEDTAHLLNGGFVLAKKEENKGKPGWEKKDTKPIRMNRDQLNELNRHLTQEQTKYVHMMVEYMSSELAELGNEASMKMYGIKKYTEQFYFPIKSWGGVLNRRSDAGISSNNENRAAQQGFSKRVKTNASNAIEIGDFTPTAIKHVAGMITYNTVGPAIENMNKVLNQQLKYGQVEYTEEGAEEDNTYKLNMRAAFENAYGKQASDYLAKFMKDMNGGVTTERTAFDKLLSLFKKNAVAGSLSVAAQQPLSYIRAAMMINPKYLAAAINPIYWKGSYAEMMKHSGIAVIKEMGKFDMNFGQTMQEWITPEGMESKARKAWNKTTDLVTGLPGAMDMMTWTRMWTAVKLEQMAENKGADFNSDEFMAKVADRFNELMRRTQVYDSVMTKSQNMRSTHFYAKTLTSFMAEPTLSLNVLADAFQNLKEKGGKAKAAKAVATFLLSAAAQAGAKAFFGAGRTPDKKKNKEENFLNKFWYNLLSEANPFGLIPGYRQIVETLTDGEFKDDTMGMIAKMGDVVDRIWKLATGEIGQKGLYRDLEDSIGQALQLMTDIPAKNIMRDFRAMVNWFSGGAAQGFTGDTYAQRETSSAVLKYQLIDNLMSNDMMGLVNKKLEDAGYKTTNAAYYDRLYAATASGNKQAAEEIRDYLINGKGVSEKTIQTNMSSRINKDDDLSGPEKVQQKLDNGASVSSIKSWITQNYKQAYIDADTNGRRQLMNELTKMYKMLDISGDDAMKIVTKWVKDEKKKDSSNAGARIASTGMSSFRGNEDLLWESMYSNTKGKLYGYGNIDLNSRKVVHNDDGSISTEQSFSFYDEDTGKEVLIPTVINGRIVSEEEAIDHYYETGEYLGRFNTPEEADEYAEKLHERQDWYYNRQ